ncbi:HPr family phosphocarrier protein [Leptospira kmetyi]|uniref:HPr family phosphocarrier protein n=2 Tax=Leptospira TaxID=171 RepID=A0A2M9XMI0_9LEPT|nr:HPr family phosphocarrier protein [Leptospira kmetyi]AYV54381.1 HPr family phosphocarrier protein [Leptospira kmetyi]PJZ30831.1 HPr family phosphocarrier protein [Leptospira kmetyi]PJZ40521.1 HPr family phosphocarrier protein [Leptospira kmetyi]TGK22735.1 HPr family phosphocarrier protein [Leptospira kmetyi]TGK27450.1 HPr family phosphocarrier protein [Leptospira kmetyi]
MKEILLKINENGTGMHARPASVFVNCASKFPCEITVVKDDVVVNGKSIMGLMMLALAPGNEFKIQVAGEKEDEALEALSNIVNNDFV